MLVPFGDLMITELFNFSIRVFELNALFTFQDFD